MTRPLQLLLAGAFAAASALAGYAIYAWQSGAFDAASSPSPAASGQMLMAAAFMGMDGQPQALAQWRGKVLVVNFWATWCAPCREEIPEFIRFQKQYGARGVQFVGIAIDNKDRVGPYAADIGINYPVLVGGVEIMEFARRIGNRPGALPFSLVVDRNGRVAATVVGVLKPEKLESLLLTLL